MLIITTSGIGALKSKSLNDKILRLELIRKMFNDTSTLMRYRALKLIEIIHELAKDKAYSVFDFLKNAENNYSTEIPFYSVWEDAICADVTLSNEEKNLLDEFGSGLGTSDIDGQLAMIDIYKEKVCTLIESAKSEYEKKGKLYRSLGVLSGITLAVFLI